MNKLIKKTSFTVIAALIALVANFFSINPASALSGSEFQPGRIIDDAVFYDGTAMTAAEIQNFLNAKAPSCDTWGQQMYNATQTRAQYGASRGYSAPYTCLKDYKQDTGYKTGQSGLCSAIEAKTGRTAAQIIDDVARACHVNQKALIVMLQKEQGLVTDDWPWSVQYRSAMGYGCPDTAPCDAEYYGFFNQVYNAALQFQRYKADPAYWNHVPFMTNNVLYQANIPSCGSRSVYIENYATAGLYNYTPYTPNQAALDNLYGMGDGCSAYGNRNFWRYFRDWFGSTEAGPFLWKVEALNIFDEGKNTLLSTDELHPGERLWVSLKVTNVGSETWYRDGPNPIKLGTIAPENHDSRYCDVTWLSCNRPAKLREESLSTGQSGHFEFYMAAPNNIGQFREYFKPVLEDRAWMDNDSSFHIYTKSNQNYSWRWNSFGAWIDSSKSTPANLDNLARNQQVYIEMRALNTSATTWEKSGPYPTRLGTYLPQNRVSLGCIPESWISCNRPASLTQQQVLPGQIGTFAFTLKAPGQTGAYREYLRPVHEYKGWTIEDGNHIYMNVTH